MRTKFSFQRKCTTAYQGVHDHSTLELSEIWVPTTLKDGSLPWPKGQSTSAPFPQERKIVLSIIEFDFKFDHSYA